MYRILLDMFIIVGMTTLTGALLFYFSNYMLWVLIAICVYSISEVISQGR